MVVVFLVNVDVVIIVNFSLHVGRIFVGGSYFPRHHAAWHDGCLAVSLLVWSVFISLFRFAPSLMLVVVFFLFYSGEARFVDQIHHVSANVPSSCSLYADGSMTIAFQAVTTGTLNDEAAGVDNLRIATQDPCGEMTVPTKMPTPSPTLSPTGSPTSSPTKTPTEIPTVSPTISPVGKVKGTIFVDTNGNAIQESGKPGIEFVAVVISDSSGATYTVTTNGNGDYMQTVSPGTVLIDIVDGSLPPGYVQTVGDDPTTVEVPVNGEATGWEARFGQPAYMPGTVMVLSPTGSLKNQAELDARSSFLSMYEELLGSSSFNVESLRNRADGSRIRVTSEMRLLRSR